MTLIESTQISAGEWLSILKIKEDFIWNLVDYFAKDTEEYRWLKKTAKQYTKLIHDLMEGIKNG